MHNYCCFEADLVKKKKYLQHKAMAASKVRIHSRHSWGWWTVAKVLRPPPHQRNWFWWWMAWRHYVGWKGFDLRWDQCCDVHAVAFVKRNFAWVQRITNDTKDPTEDPAIPVNPRLNLCKLPRIADPPSHAHTLLTYTQTHTLPPICVYVMMIETLPSLAWELYFPFS